VRLRDASRRIRGLVERHWRAALALAVPLIVLGLVSGPVSLAVPRTCDACHDASGEYTEWTESSHADASCESCHEQRGYVFGLGNSIALGSEVWRTVFGPQGDTAWVADDACIRCHPGIGNEETLVVNGLRMSHRGLREAGFRCAECHAAAAHVLDEDRIDEPTMSTCAECHDNRTASGECVVCHPDAEGSGERERRDAEFARTHGANWESTHGMGDLTTCVLCHEPAKCESCHGVALPHDSGFAATHGRNAVPGRGPCVAACHTTAFCDSCHGIEMPHPGSFLPEHSSIAQGYEDPVCARCHTTTNCDECHEKHIHPGGPHSMRSDQAD